MGRDAAARIATAVIALDAELAAAGIPAISRELVLIELLGQIWHVRTGPARVARWQAIAAQRAARQVGVSGRERRGGTR